MKHLYRIISLALVLITLAGFSACKNDTEQNKEDTTDTVTGTISGTNAETTVAEGDKYPYTVENLGNADGTPSRYTMLIRTQRGDHLFADDDGSVFHEAVYQRNMMLEELFNIRITGIEGGESNGNEYIGRLDADYISGEGAYDLVTPAWWWGVETRGYFINLLDYSDELDFDADWWFDGWNDNTQLCNYMACCVGDAAFDLYENLEVVYFNKTMAESLGLDIFSYVDNMKWTLEVMDTYGAMAQKDMNGNGIFNPEENDVYGTVLNSSTLPALFFSLGAKYSQRTSGDEMELCFTSEKNINVFNKLYSFINEEEWTFYTTSSTLGYVDAKIFCNGNALFLCTAFRVAPYIIDSGISYGFVPFPMYDESQGEYISTAYDVTYFAILTSAPDAHKSTLVLNALNAATYDTVGKTYFETMLKYRYSDDPNTARMVDVVRNNVNFDFAWIYIDSLGWVTAKFPYYIEIGNREIVSYYKSEEKAADKALQKLIETYRDLKDR